MIHLTQQERKVFFFFAFALLLGLSFSLFSRTQACRRCLFDLYSGDDVADEELKVDVNRATETELQKVPGIGPATAASILEFRRRHGRIENLEELKAVPGIKDVRFEKLRPYLSVEAMGRVPKK